MDGGREGGSEGDRKRLCERGVQNQNPNSAQNRRQTKRAFVFPSSLLPHLLLLRSGANIESSDVYRKTAAISPRRSPFIFFYSTLGTKRKETRGQLRL